MAGMNHDMKPAPAPIATTIPQRVPAPPAQPTVLTGWDVPLVTTGAGMAGWPGMAGMNHDMKNTPAPTPMPAPPSSAPEPVPVLEAEPLPQFLVSNNIAPVVTPIMITVTREAPPVNLGTLVPQVPREKKAGDAFDDDWK